MWSHFPTSWKQTKIITCPYHPETLNSWKICVQTACCPWRTNKLRKLFWKQSKGTRTHGLCSVSVWFHAHHSTTLQYMRLWIWKIVFIYGLDFGKAFDTTWHPHYNSRSLWQLIYLERKIKNFCGRRKLWYQIFRPVPPTICNVYINNAA